VLWLKAPGNTDHTSGAIVVTSTASTAVLPASSMRIPSCAASGCAGASKDRKAIANYWHAYILIGVSKLAKNRIDAAIQALESAVQPGVRDAIALAYLGMTYGLSRRFSEAKAIFNELNVLAREKYVSPTNFASVYFGLVEMGKAFDWLEKALEEKDGLVMNALRASDPSLRAHPRYHALLRKMNLEP